MVEGVRIRVGPENRTAMLFWITKPLSPIVFAVTMATEFSGRGLPEINATVAMPSLSVTAFG